MATTSETIYTHTCDLCGTGHDQADLAHLHGPAEVPGHAGPRADICSACRTRPVGDVLDFLVTQRRTAGIRVVTRSA